MKARTDCLDGRLRRPLRRSGLAAALGAGLLLAGCGGAPPHAARSRSTAPVAGSKPTGLVEAVVKVVPIPMTYGINGEAQAPPKTVTVALPRRWVGRVWAYWADQVVLAPSHWQGSGSVGADGSGSTTLHPAGAKTAGGGSVVLFSDGGCYGCGVDAAARYFPAVHRRWSRYSDAPGTPPPPLVELAAERVLGPGLLAYRLPSRGALEVQGVAFTGLLGKGTSVPSFVNLETSLPSSDRDLAAVILNYEIAHGMPGR